MNNEITQRPGGETCLAYLRGDLPAEEFIQLAREKPEIPQWFQSLIPEEAADLTQDHMDAFLKTCPSTVFHYEAYGDIRCDNAIHTGVCRHPFWFPVRVQNAFDQMKDRVDMAEFFRTTDLFDTHGGQDLVYDLLADLAKTALPDLEITYFYETRFHREYSFQLDVCPEYYEGPEVNAAISEKLQEIFYSGGTMAARKQAARAWVKEYFHIEGKKRPYWAQGGEWPMGKNSPMQYISRKRDGELVQLLFRDVDTGEERIVEQFY